MPFIATLGVYQNELLPDRLFCPCTYCRMSRGTPEPGWTDRYDPVAFHNTQIEVQYIREQETINRQRERVPEEGVLLPIEEEEYDLSPRRTLQRKKNETKTTTSNSPTNLRDLGRNPCAGVAIRWGFD